MLSETDEARALSQLGLTITQAKIYLTLLKTGRTTAGILETLTKTPRPEIYRTLAELQEKGLVEKEITQPYSFLATPIQIALQTLAIQKREDYRRYINETKAFLRKFPEEADQPIQEGDYKLIMLTGRARVTNKLKKQIDSARSSLDLLTALPRWLIAIEECCENYEKALSRGVKIRVLAEPLNSEISQRVSENLLPASNFTLKLASSSHNTYSGIFDREVALVNFFPSKPVGESPIIWTNHPSFVDMCQCQFESIWKSTKKQT